MNPGAQYPLGLKVIVTGNLPCDRFQVKAFVPAAMSRGWPSRWKSPIAVHRRRKRDGLFENRLLLKAPRAGDRTKIGFMSVTDVEVAVALTSPGEPGGLPAEG